MLYAKEVEGALLPAEDVPAGFEEAMRRIQGDTVMGVWCVRFRDEMGLLEDGFADSVCIFLLIGQFGHLAGKGISCWRQITGPIFSVCFLWLI